MRILFTFVGGLGHFVPLADVARAAKAAGHTVAFGCPPAMVPVVEHAGLTAFAMGSPLGAPPARLPLRAPDPRREERDLRERFARGAARQRVPLTLARCEEWCPDVLVCDETDFGAAVAAERLGLPFALVLVTAAGGFVRAEVVGEAIDEVRSEHGLPPDRRLERPARYLVLSPFPPGFRDPAFPLPATAHAFRPVLRPSQEDGPEGDGFDWRPPRPGAPTLYFTLGTVFHLECGDLAARVVEGLRELEANVIVTVGPGVDPAELGPQPSHVRIERFVPQPRVLPHCDLVVSHGGSGSVMGALAHGLPSLLLPLGADQPHNAARCTALGVARVLDVMAVTPGGVRDAAAAVLADPAWRRRSQQLQAEIAALPGPRHAVELLQRIAGRDAKARG